MFEEEYNAQLNEVLTLEDTPYNRYLKGIDAAKTHNGYFSIDKKSKRLVEPAVKTRGENRRRDRRRGRLRPDSEGQGTAAVLR